jgi:hypothetical protein
MIGGKKYKLFQNYPYLLSKTNLRNEMLARDIKRREVI